VQRARALLANAAQPSWAEWGLEVVPVAIADAHTRELEEEWAAEERTAQAERDEHERVVREQAEREAERLRVEQEAAAAQAAQVAEAQRLAASQQEDALMTAASDESDDSDYRYSGSASESESVSSRGSGEAYSDEERGSEGVDDSDGEAGASNAQSSMASKREAEDELENGEEPPRQVKRARTDTVTATPKMRKKVPKAKESAKPAHFVSRYLSMSTMTDMRFSSPTSRARVVAQPGKSVRGTALY